MTWKSREKSSKILLIFINLMVLVIYSDQVINIVFGLFVWLFCWLDVCLFFFEAGFLCVPLMSLNSVEQADLELRYSSASASLVLRLKTCSTT